RQFLYHFYNDVKAPGGSVRKLHWRDLQQENNARIAYLRDRGLKRFNHMTGYLASQDADVVKALDKFGFGHVRSLAQFEAFSGVDFKRKVATERGLRCQFIENLSRYRDRPIFVPEVDDPKRQQGQRPQGAVRGNAAVAVQRQLAPVEQPRLAAAALKLLEPGDFMPMFEMYDTSKTRRMVEAHGGKFGLFVFLPAARPDMAAAFYHDVQKRLEQAGLHQDVLQMIILDEVMERALAFREKFGVEMPLALDPERRVARALGVIRQGEPMPFAVFLVDTNLKITHVHRQAEPGNMAAMLVNDLALEMASFKKANAQPRTIRHMAPALMVPQVFTPEFCAKCIQAFRTGHTFEGTVGAREKKMYRDDIKIRTDFIVRGELLEEVDDKFSRSFFPEIQKVFGFEVTGREIYK
ncbi:MAG: peroxiredoxin family protein, partial [Rickettsiales bacterium]|nr:peroxiredoxin family protein [Rickettsiales bacterium]